MSKFKFASLILELKGEKKDIHPYIKEFEVYNGNKATDIKLNFNGTVKPYFNEPIGYLGKNVGSYSKNGLYINNNPFFSYEVRNLFTGGCIEVDVFYRKLSFIRSLYVFLKGVLSVEYHSKEHFLKGCFASYNALYWIFSVALMKQKKCFIHSGTMTLGDETLVLAGTGGCGKTSSVLSFLEKDNSHYLSEDFGVLSTKGTINYCSKTISLYYSDIQKGSSIAKSSLNQLGFYNKIKWFFLTKIIKLNPIIKVEPRSFSNTSADKEEELNKFVYLSRIKTDKVKLHKGCSNNIAKRSAISSIRELKSFIDILNIIEANKPLECEFYPTSEQFYQKYLSILQKGLVSIDCYFIEIPEKIHPDKIRDTLLEELDINV
jgi:hypothetical protein